MALTKISRGLLNTGVSDSSDSTFLTVDSSENATLAGNLTVSGNLTVTGTSTTVDTVTMNAQNAVIFEGATADNYETTLSIVDPTADHTQYLINQDGYVPVLAAATTTAITSTPAELNLIDGGTARGTDALASGDGILINDAGTMKMTNVDTVKTFMGTTTEEIQDIAGAMFTSNTETGITATYQDGDGTIDLVVGTLNQDTTGTAATVTGAAQTNITSLGTLTTLTVDDMTLNGSTISDAGDFTLDIGGDIILDANGDNVTFAKNTVQCATIDMGSANFDMKSLVSDADIIFRGNDGGSAVTALTLDMSEAGAATFTSSVDATNYKVGGAQGSDGQVLTSTGSGVAWEAVPAGITNKTFGTSSIMIGDSATGTIDAANYNTGLGVDVFAALTTGDQNTVVGFAAGKALTTGLQNVFIGEQAGELSATASANTFIGCEAGGGAIVTGEHNVGVGRKALFDHTSGASNTAVGRSAMENNTSGHSNVAIGKGTYAANIDGVQSTVVGMDAFKTATSDDGAAIFGYLAGRDANGATHTTLIGAYSGYKLTTGDKNTFVGTESGPNGAACTADENTGVGYNSLAAVTSGANNTAVGSGALKVNTTGTGNNSFGYGSLDANVGGSYNTAMGHVALSTNISGTDNTGIGGQVLYNNVGSHNTAVGSTAGYAITSGTYNVAIGSSALRGVCTGSYNVAIGFEALKAVTSGGENVAIGRDAMHDIGSGTQNVAIGHESMGKNVSATGNVAIGFQALENITGATNIGIGWKAGEATEGGTYNVFIGNECRGTHPSHSQAIAIGSNIDAAPGQVAFGTQAMGKTYNEFNTDALWSNGSDVRLKQNITDSTLGLNFINDLRPVTYTWKPSNELPEEFPMYQEENGRDTETIMTGLIAQEVKTAIDTSGVSRFAGWGEDNDGIQQVRGQAFVFPLINAIKELSAKNEELSAKNEELEEKLNMREGELEQRVHEIEQRLV